MAATGNIKNAVIREERAKYLDEDINKYADEIEKFFIDPERARRERNNYYTQSKCRTYKDYFDHVETNPLTEPQRRACVENEDANLVLAGAGTGKTSTMVGKAGYLIKSGQAKPSEILMIAFARKAAEEMQERVQKRIGREDIIVKTFHGLGKDIIATVEREQPSLSKMAEDDNLRVKFIDGVLVDLLEDSVYKGKLINYFANYLFPVKNILDFKSKGEYIEYCQQVELRTLQGELVKSNEELMIANYLYQQGVEYQYEPVYEIDTSGPDFRRYKPDFYLPEYQIYIEHFAVDEEGNTPAFIDHDEYTKGMEWKRTIHNENRTHLIETFSYEHRQGQLLERLKDKLLSAGVIFVPLQQDSLLETLRDMGRFSEFSKLIAEFLKLFKSAFLTIKELYEIASSHIDKLRMTVVVELFEPIYERYQAFLDSRKEIDFEDMIAKSIEYVERGQFQSPYRFILVDEFQDISASRAKLVKALKNQNQNNSLFCVGDDWQSIYRFTGSDIALTRNFSDHFGVAAINILDITFRFNQMIGEVASKFIQKNPIQIKKNIKSLRTTNDKSVTLIPNKSTNGGIVLALSEISKRSDNGSSVLILGRFWHVFPEDAAKLFQQYPKLRIDYLSAHSAKGKEADYVIIIGLAKGKFGFPSAVQSNSILSLLLPPEEDFKYAEERRLFYVALTRARHHVYLVSDPENMSDFVRELRKGEYPVNELNEDSGENTSWVDEISCPECRNGYLVQKQNNIRRTYFYGCSNYPYCDYTQNGCPKCGSVQKYVFTHMRCSSDKCKYKEPLCPQCGGILKLRLGKYGKFWGCEHYRGKDPLSCNYTVNKIDIAGLDTDINAK